MLLGNYSYLGVVSQLNFKVGIIFLTDAISPLWHVVYNFTGVVKKLCG